MPERIQLRRTKGWRKPEGAIVVSRPSRWGNPYRVGIDGSREDCVLFFRMWLEETREGRTLAVLALDELRGHDLACWCRIGQPCHADVLLEVANG